jgi:hypothetical protein
MPYPLYFGHSLERAIPLMQRHFADKARFLYSSPGSLVEFDEKRLESYLPLTRPEGSKGPLQPIPYRLYLQAIRQFLRDHSEEFLEVLSGQGLEDLAQIQSIDIISEKHGSDFHPARIQVQTADARHCFAVNVALTPRGKERVSQDFHLLGSFRERFHAKFTPEAYFMGEVRLQPANVDDLVAVMFMAEWLEGYHEFHRSVDPESGSKGTVLWDLDQGHKVLSPDIQSEIFRKAALILTYYYDTKTFAEVYPWHHAAGDFVVKLPEGVVDVKLITLRQYAPRIVFPEGSSDNRSEALSMFLSNLTIRMRLDRLDGLGKIDWAGDHAVEATIRGFLAGMGAQIADGMCDDTFPVQFLQEMKRMSLSDLAEVFQTVIGSYDEKAPDLPVILDHLADHIFEVYRVIQQLRPIPS